MRNVQESMEDSQIRGTQVFPSKRDGWLVAVLLSAAIAMAATAVSLAIARPAPSWLALLASALLLVAAVLVVWMLSATSYRVSNAELRILCGPFRWKLALDAVDDVAPKRDPLSSPALSLDRLHIVYGEAKASVLVSPVDRNRFLDCLVSHTSHLRRDGDHLVRVI